MNKPDTIREALRNLPSLALASSGRAPSLDEIYFPEAHAEVLDPDVSLVVGNRGMGKTFWSLVLANSALRPGVAKRYLRFRTVKLDDLEVSFGFSDAEGTQGAISRPVLDSLSKHTTPELIWRAVLIKRLRPYLKSQVPEDFQKLATWLAENPQQQVALFSEADDALSSAKKRLLVLFDQLDQLASSWNEIQDLTTGLVKTALAMKSYRGIKVKIFMRPDQAENRQIFRFPDGSKILGGSRVLTWRVTDLYGLLFFEILRHPSAAQAFRAICKSASVNPSKLHDRLNIPVELAGDPERQGRVFDLIAGELMGRGSKRGRPYTWIPAHLADGRGEISPRTFLKVMKTAAEFHSATAEETPIDFKGIQEGVRSASSNRLAELEEDYPWVSTALEPLRGILVPCDLAEIENRWQEAKTAERISHEFEGSSAPIDLVIANMVGPEQEAAVLVKVLDEIGVFEERKNGKINVPDIFRVNAGILRKGGITPQQRRKL